MVQAIRNRRGAEQAGPEQQGKLRQVVRVASGNFLEMYDFMVFGYYAAAIGKTFFPAGGAFGSLLKALLTFGAGFLMRPLGALVLGAYIDEHGRKAGLILTLGLMSVGTLAVACLPGYATLGILAPLLVLAARLVQGFSAGVELGGVSVYLAEIAPPGHKGFYVSWQSASQQVAVITAAILGVALTARLSPADMERWGWRVPLLAGCLIIPVLFFIRRSLTETDEFLQQERHPQACEIFRSVAENWQVVGLGMLLATLTSVAFYLITVYTASYGKTVLHLADRDTLTVTLCVGLSNLLWLPLMGALSDRIGRRPLLIGCTVLVMACAYPALRWLTAAPSFQRLLTVELLLSFLYASYNSAMVVYLTEIMPPRVRTSGFSLAYSLATAIGGFTPAICTYLIPRTGNQAAPGLVLSTAAALALGATFLLRHRARVS